MQSRLIELAKVFGKLGVIGFGGPAAHIAMMEDEIVTRRQWMTHEHFLDLVGATNLIPGPNSTEMTMHVGYHRAGIPGLIVAGSCFIGPAVLLTGFLAWFYVAFGHLPAVEPFLYGIKPAVLAIILGAVLKLGKKAMKTHLLLAIGIVAGLLVLFGLNEVFIILGLGIAGALVLPKPPRPPPTDDQPAATTTSPGLLLLAATGTTAAAANATIWQLGWVFLKVGMVLFGSGYVLVAFLEGDLVQRYGWLTSQQLLDAIAIGQFTPGPVLSTSTFIGYQIKGVAGAIVATVGIFLPSFVYVALLNPHIPKLRRSRWTAAFLDAVNASAVGLMAGVLLELCRAALFTGGTLGQPEPVAWIIAVAAIVLVTWKKISSVWLVVGGAAVGAALQLV